MALNNAVVVGRGFNRDITMQHVWGFSP
jgi:hypothetical protein